MAHIVKKAESEGSCCKWKRCRMHVLLTIQRHIKPNSKT